jgi:hypothetical protein
MHFTRHDEYFAVTRIAGPRHNLLQLRFGTESRDEPVCECLPPIGTCEHAPLDPQALVEHVQAGVDEANERFGSAHRVTHIRYVENDTGPEEVYALLASSIVERLETDGEYASTWAAPPKPPAAELD